jgi:hypothetical protein
VRASVQHISQVLEGGVEAFAQDEFKVRPVDALIICVGLGARMLGGVEDKDVYPVRGQTVQLRAPWIEEGRSFVVESGAKTYIVPRRGGTVGHLLPPVRITVIFPPTQVIIGGTRAADDWYAQMVLDGVLLMTNCQVS